MVYHGRVINGVVIFENGDLPAEGVRVRIETVEKAEAIEQRDDATIWDDLLRLAGTAEGLPADFARQHDHYLYGTPKR